ncbi:MAG: hypothetical protein O7D36_01710 [Gammaproteobacteria bacterium]|nr:hypothetical protein [Gammaproteobacteria bacterium]
MLHRQVAAYVLGMAAIENAGKYVEFSIEGLDYYPWQATLFSPNYEIIDGRVSLSDKPG